MNNKTDTAFALAHFAASSSAVLIAALHRGKPITDRDVEHLLRLLATAKANAPDQSDSMFDRLAETVAGKHYEDG